MQIVKESTMLEATVHNESAWRSRVKFVFLAFAVIGAFFLLAEHQAHVLSWLPWLFLAACPLMHVFMHHGHGAHHHGGNGGSDGRPSAAPGPGYTTPPGPGYTDSGSTSHHHHGGQS
jgi:hypothetical protein